MTHNFSILYRTPDSAQPLWFETQSKCLDDAMIELYEHDGNAEFIRHEVEHDPAAFEPETDTINQAIQSRLNR